MIVVLVSVFVLALLGTALAGLSIHDQQQAIRQQKNAEAMYVARGGAEAIAAYLLANPLEAPRIIAQGEDEVILDNGAKLVVTVTETETGRLLISSTGYVGDYSERLVYSLEPDPELTNSTPFYPDFDKAVFADGKITLKNAAAIIGSVGTNSCIDNSVSLYPCSIIDGNIQVGIGASASDAVYISNAAQLNGSITNLDKERHYPLPVFPEFPDDLPSRGSLIGWGTQTISGDGAYDTINIGNDGKLIFTVDSGTLRVRVKKMTLGNNAEVIINGTGSLILYIDEEFNFKKDSKVNLFGDPNKILLYYKGGNPAIKLDKSVLFFGCLYAEDADIDVANGGAIVGSIFTGGTKVELSNSCITLARVIYAPNATVTLHSAGLIYGPIVCKEFETKNCGCVYFRPEEAEIIDGIWGKIPDLEFDDELEDPVQRGYIKGSWSN
jgi:hypothetical protein